MNCDVTLTAEEFKTLHNALCALDCLNDDKISTQVEIIRDALTGAYDQESAAFDRKFEHYDSVRKDLGLNAIWSITEVDNLNERHPYPSDAFVVYKNHWGENKQVHCAVYGGTWAAVYVAANACIRNSGDEHHVFIENFELKNGNELHMTTGS
jgi:hypothetical protein